MKLKVLAISVLSVVIFAFALFEANPKPPITSPLVGDDLPVVGSAENFRQILDGFVKKESYFGGRRGTLNEATEEKSMAVADAAGSGDFSTTNVQVDGVDEADRVKTDGTYMYQLRENQFVISKVNPVNKMEVVYVKQFNMSEYYPHEFLIDENQLVLIGYGSTYKNNEYKDFTRISVYDLLDRKNVELLREVEIDGHYVSSRKINHELYLVTNKGLPYHILESRPFSKNNANIENLKPEYRDSLMGSEGKKVAWDEIHYFPGSNDSNFLLVAGIDLANLDKEISLSTYLGAGHTVYASSENLYITRTEYEYPETVTEKIADMMIMPHPTNGDTLIYKFKLDKARVIFVGEGKVEGILLNQFSMDEHNGFFRITTTKGDMWSETNPSENLLFILDEKLLQVGAIRNIARGERIYSARFMGDRGYIVTFKQVDPLFVLDLKDPKNPTILGELKIPGFSDYLHPYDENHIIGFGRDTEENDMGGAVVKGFKMALFDITDVTKPKEKFVEIIGGSGTYSELLYNHKALLFSKEKNIIAFPIELYEEAKQIGSNERFLHAHFTFQGAYVYGLDLEKGFQLKTRISHYGQSRLTDNDYDYQRHVSRIVYIGENIYTISNSKIEAHDLANFEKQGQIIF